MGSTALPRPDSRMTNIKLCSSIYTLEKNSNFGFIHSNLPPNSHTSRYTLTMIQFYPGESGGPGQEGRRVAENASFVSGGRVVCALTPSHVN